MFQDLESKRKKIKKWVTIGAIFVGCVFVAPIVGLAIQGLIGLALFGIISLITINLTPWLSDVVANWRLKLIKAEAARNPVETLQNDFVQKQSALSKFAEAITVFATEIRNFSVKLDGFRKQWSEEESRNFTDQLCKMKQLLEIRKAKYDEAQDSLEKYAIQIKKAESIWIMGQAAAKMTAAAGMTDEDFMQKIKTDTALDAVTSSMNRAFAELETSLMEENKEKVSNILEQVELSPVMERRA
jgi:hypothetical protein